MASNVANEALTNEINLTDVNFDCLERIFGYASIGDLVNIVHTTKQFKEAADLVFVQKYRNKLFHFHIDYHYPYIRRPSCEEDEAILIRDMQTALRLLRSFGHMISKMQLTHTKVVRPASPKLLSHANEYCSTLTGITFHGIFNNAFEWSLIKPFPNVKNVTFARCTFGVKMSKLNKWFPAMNCLVMNRNILVNDKYLHQKFPNLEHLAIDTGGKANSFSMVETIRLNQQLRSLSLNRDECRWEYFQAASAVTQLKRLVLHGYMHRFTYSDGHFHSVKELEIVYLFSLRITTWMVPIELKFDRLEEFTLSLGVYIWDTRFITFLKRHQSIAKFTLRSIDKRIDAQVLTEIVAALPRLKELNIFGVLFPIGDLLRFIDIFQLDSYGFSVTQRHDADELKKRLGDEWTISVDDSIGFKIKMERKIWMNFD